MRAAGSYSPFTTKTGLLAAQSSSVTPSTPLIASFSFLLQPSQQLWAPLKVPLETLTGLAFGGSAVPLSSLSLRVLLSIVPQKPAAVSLSSAFCAAASLAAVNVTEPPLAVASLPPPPLIAPVAAPLQPLQQRCRPLISYDAVGAT